MNIIDLVGRGLNNSIILLYNIFCWYIAISFIKTSYETKDSAHLQRIIVFERQSYSDKNEIHSFQRKLHYA